MRDAVELEWAGVPSVAIIHYEMTGSAKAIARISGHEDYEFVTVGYPHIPTAVWTADEAATQLEEGISVEILDLRSLSPYDWGAIADSVRKTNRAVVVSEDSISWGYGAEIAARGGGQVASAAGDLSLQETGAVLKRSE